MSLNAEVNKNVNNKVDALYESVGDEVWLPSGTGSNPYLMAWKNNPSLPCCVH